jgi:hypothetical protein
MAIVEHKQDFKILLNLMAFPLLFIFSCLTLRFLGLDLKSSGDSTLLPPLLVVCTSLDGVPSFLLMACMVVQIYTSMYLLNISFTSIYLSWM